VHELSIAFYMVEQASQAAAAQKARRVTVVKARIGQLSGVVKDSLLFSWDIAAKGTLCEGARLEIDDVPITVRCPADGKPHTLAYPPRFRCPVCDAPTPELLTGRELELATLEWEP
jgi:hydrogenase nickel incorporation protein HypA/HybF